MEGENKISFLKQTLTTDQFDYIVAFLLGLATIFGALSAYYATLWGGNQSQYYVKGIITMSQSGTNYLEALHDFNSLEMTDFKDNFIEGQWKEATENGESEQAKYFESKMSPELEKIYNVSNDSAEIAIAEYDEALDLKLDDLNTRMDSAIIQSETAKKTVIKGDQANAYGDEFTFVTVLFTIVLFFGGMAAVTRNYKLKGIYLGTSLALFIGSLILMLTIPFP